jgi:hypothetical protein
VEGDDALSVALLRVPGIQCLVIDSEPEKAKRINQ